MQNKSGIMKPFLDNNRYGNMEKLQVYQKSNNYRSGEYVINTENGRYYHNSYYGRMTLLGIWTIKRLKS